MLLEKVGGVARPDQYLHAFQEVLSDTGLMDMGYKGYPLTWDNGGWETSLWKKVPIISRYCLTLKVRSLFNVDGVEISGPELEDHVLQLFKGLFASETRGVGEIDLDFAPCQISSGMNDLLLQPYSFEEIVQAVK
ncbi:hypothetical protein GH714_012864 [Hevea brasiliensis]|uniref:Uncharacterized protein n=1 Tax=Hevea brasiliensis TaxID=3981 RepID=A0A6A6MDC4_HEVBR|nr:hypothetical protein GH714_012864 [Hevea brasiliensis]